MSSDQIPREEIGDMAPGEHRVVESGYAVLKGAMRAGPGMAPAERTTLQVKRLDVESYDKPPPPSRSDKLALKKVAGQLRDLLDPPGYSSLDIAGSAQVEDNTTLEATRINLKRGAKFDRGVRMEAKQVIAEGGVTFTVPEKERWFNSAEITAQLIHMPHTDVPAKAKIKAKGYGPSDEPRELTLRDVGENASVCADACDIILRDAGKHPPKDTAPYHTMTELSVAPGSGFSIKGRDARNIMLWCETTAPAEFDSFEGKVELVASSKAMVGDVRDGASVMPAVRYPHERPYFDKKKYELKSLDSPGMREYQKISAGLTVTGNVGKGASFIFDGTLHLKNTAKLDEDITIKGPKIVVEKDNFEAIAVLKRLALSGKFAGVVTLGDKEINLTAPPPGALGNEVTDAKAGPIHPPKETGTGTPGS